MNQIELTEQTCNDAEQTPPAIRLIGVGKSFANGNQTIEVLKNVNLAVPPQAIVVSTCAKVEMPAISFLVTC